MTTTTDFAASGQALTRLNAAQQARETRPSALLDLLTRRALLREQARTSPGEERRRLLTEIADVEATIDDLVNTSGEAERLVALDLDYQRARAADGRRALERLAAEFEQLAARAVKLPMERLGDLVAEARTFPARALEYARWTGTDPSLLRLGTAFLFNLIPLQSTPPLGTLDVARFIASLAAYRGWLSSPPVEPAAPAAPAPAVELSYDEEADAIVARGREYLARLDLPARYREYNAAADVLARRGVGTARRPVASVEAFVRLAARFAWRGVITWAEFGSGVGRQGNVGHAEAVDAELWLHDGPDAQRALDVLGGTASTSNDDVYDAKLDRALARLVFQVARALGTLRSDYVRYDELARVVSVEPVPSNRFLFRRKPAPRHVPPASFEDWITTKLLHGAPETAGR